MALPRCIRQFWLLLWKNFILQIRRPVGTVFEIIVPVAFSSLLIIARHGLRNTSSTKSFSTFKAELPYHASHKLYTFYPNTSWAQKIVNSSSSLRKGLVSFDQFGKTFSSEEEAVWAATSYPNIYEGAIVFQNVQVGDLPKQISYKIRLGKLYTESTRRIYPKFRPPGPRRYSRYAEIFVAIQQALDQAIIKLQTKQDASFLRKRMTLFPYPAYKVQPFIKLMQFLMPMLFVIAFIYTAVCIIREILREKNEGLKEAMKMMGLSNWVHWLSWFMKNFIFLTISCVLLTILLKVAKIFEYTDGTLLFFFFLSYSVSVIFFCFAISVFFYNVVIGMLFGAILWIFSYVPYAVLATGNNSFYELMTVTQKAAACLLPNTCLGIGIQVLSKFEISQIGGQWSNIATAPSIDEDFHLLNVIIMFFVQSLLWWMITWYVEAVFPGKFGVPKPFYFFLTPSYWCQSMGTVARFNGVESIPMKPLDEEENPNVEPAPQDWDAAVDIKDLHKIFNGGKTAVNGLNLKIYKGQITALLGHNGAGKTTTISILTGLFTPTSGSATINGKDIHANMDSIRENMGLCPQHDILFDRLTVEEHLEFFLALKGFSAAQGKTRINEMLKEIQLEDKRKARSCTLSGGMKRKLCCAIALIGDPDIVFLDEPTSGIDTYARRSIWTLLEKYASRTTIILTTHFMDEADYLSDRIAIMTHGQLRCCGSSLFLKKRYGIGYRMILVKTPNIFDEASVKELIQRTIPAAKMDSDSATEQSYVLEHKTSSKFRDLFEQLEENKDELGIQSFGVSFTSLEEVFLKVGEEPVDAKVSVEEDESSVCQEEGKLTGMDLKQAQFKALFLKRFLNARREKKSILTQLFLPLTVLLCGLLINAATSSTKDMPSLALDLSIMSEPGTKTYALVADYRTGQPRNWTKWTKYIGSYFRTVRVSPKYVTKETQLIKKMNEKDSVSFQGKQYNLRKDGYLACCKYGFLVLNAKCQNAIYTLDKFNLICGANSKTSGYAANTKCIEASVDPFSSYNCPMAISETDLHDPYTFLNEYILRKADSTKRFFDKHLFGLSFRNVSASSRGFFIDTWYTNQALHTLPSVVSAANNIILRYLKDDATYGIQTISHPLPLTSKEKDEATVTDPTNVVMSIFVTLTSAALAASFVVFLVAEKKSKAKHLQFVSGVNGTVYWLATFCWDVLSYLVPAVIMMILFAIPQLSDIKGKDLVAVCFIIFLHGLAVIPFTYLLSFLFARPFAAYAAISLFGFGAGVAMFFAVFICRIRGMSCFDAAPTMHKIFLLFPTYGFSSGILDIKLNANNRALCAGRKECRLLNLVKWQDSAFSLDYPGVGMTCLYFVIESVLFLLLVILIEERFFITFTHRPPPPRPLNPSEDDDVKDEKHRVAKMEHDALKSNAVVIKDLTKTYKSNNITAVDSISVAIPKGECFGLLGVNGAGKTSTFSMLTGELGISGGTAYLKGFNIQKDLRMVQQQIGYCPQYDALVDHLTGREMLEMFARLRGIPADEIPPVVNRVLYELNLNAFADRLCGTYSGGNKRKLSTALAIAGDPLVMFLDEPTSGMDPVSKRFIWNKLTNILESGHRSIILTSHSMDECEALCNRLVIMVNGVFKCIGSPQHLKSKFGQAYMLTVKVGESDSKRRRDSFRTRTASQKSGVRINPSMLTSNDIDVDPAMWSPPEESISLLQQETDNVKAFIAKHFPGCCLLEERPGFLQYEIQNARLKWSYMFGTLEENAAEMKISDYSLGQTTLEQVFINFARHQEGEVKGKRRCCCC